MCSVSDYIFQSVSVSVSQAGGQPKSTTCDVVVAEEIVPDCVVEHMLFVGDPFDLFVLCTLIILCTHTSILKPSDFCIAQQSLFVAVMVSAVDYIITGQNFVFFEWVWEWIDWEWDWFWDSWEWSWYEEYGDWWWEWDLSGWYWEWRSWQWRWVPKIITRVPLGA